MVDEASPSSTSSFELLDMDSAPAPYQEVQPHWFFCPRCDDNTTWLPFSRDDSDKLENALNTGEQLVYILYMYKIYRTCLIWSVKSKKIGSLLLKDKISTHYCC